MNEGDFVVGKYRLTRRIAEGGMGEVWAARNEDTHRDFAIKFLKPALLEHPEALDRFVREAKTTGRLRHPSVVDVFDIGRTETGLPFIVMELLAGEGLDSVLARRGTMPPAEACIYLSQIARALDLAHDAGVVHRDVSASNVFLARVPGKREPTPKILDFGVSKTIGPELDERVRTGNGAVIGCPQYMSPEQASGAEKVDRRTDVWSLGVVLYECFAGTPPFSAKNYNALMCAIMSRPHRPIAEACPGLDPDLADLVDRCLAKDREQRVQTARQLALALESIAFRLAQNTGAVATPRRRAIDGIARSSEPPLAVAVDAKKRPGRPRPWRSPMVLSGSAVGGTLLGIGLGVALAAHRTDQPLERANGVAATMHRAAAAAAKGGPVVTPVLGQPPAEKKRRKGRRPRGPLGAAPPDLGAEPVDPNSLPIWDRPLVASTEPVTLPTPDPADDDLEATLVEPAEEAAQDPDPDPDVVVGLMRQNPYR